MAWGGKVGEEIFDQCRGQYCGVDGGLKRQNGREIAKFIIPSKFGDLGSIDLGNPMDKVPGIHREGGVFEGIVFRANAIPRQFL